MLLHVLSNLKFWELCAVAKTNRRFMGLAQRACATLTESRNVMPKNFHPSKATSVEMLNIFVEHIRHFDGKHFLKEICLSPRLWQRLDVAKLKSLKIDTNIMTFILGDNPTGQPYVDCFVELESLTLVHDVDDEMGEDMEALQSESLDIPFPVLMPKLKKLTLLNGRGDKTVYCQDDKNFPRTLVSIKMDGYRELYEPYLRFNPSLREVIFISCSSTEPAHLEYLIKYGLHERIKYLNCSVNMAHKTPFKHLIQFQELKYLNLVAYRDRGNYVLSKGVDYVFALKHLPKLEELHVDEMANRYPNRVMMAIAKNIPPRLSVFKFHCLYPISTKNRAAFQAAMPATCKYTLCNYRLGKP